MFQTIRSKMFWLGMSTLVFANNLFAEEGVEAAAQVGKNSSSVVAGGFGFGIAAVGVAISLAIAASAGLNGMARNPSAGKHAPP